jgi:hypothetical protein
MSDRTQLVARYQQLRNVGRGVSQTLVERLGKQVMDEGARKLGILQRGILVFDSEAEMAVLMDFCIYDVRRGGLNAVERFVEENPYRPGSDEALMLAAMKEARFALLQVESVERGAGAEVLDLVQGESRFLYDLGLGMSAHPGLVLAARLHAPEDICMTTGAAMPLAVLEKGGWDDPGQRAVQTMASFLLDASTPEERSEATANIIRACLKQSDHFEVKHLQPAGRPPSIPGPAPKPPPGVGRYDPCPCGSGKKFKFCCGARR